MNETKGFLKNLAQNDGYGFLIYSKNSVKVLKGGVSKIKLLVRSPANSC